MNKVKEIVTDVVMFCGLIVSIALHLSMYGNFLQENFFKNNFNTIITDYKIFFLIFNFFLLASIINCALKLVYKIKNISIVNCTLIAGTCFFVIFVLSIFMPKLFTSIDETLLFQLNLSSVIISMVSTILTVIITTRNISKAK